MPLNHILRKCTGRYERHKLQEKNQPPNVHGQYQIVFKKRKNGNPNTTNIQPPENQREQAHVINKNFSNFSQNQDVTQGHFITESHAQTEIHAPQTLSHELSRYCLGMRKSSSYYRIQFNNIHLAQTPGRLHEIRCGTSWCLSYARPGVQVRHKAVLGGSVRRTKIHTRPAVPKTPRAPLAFS